MAAYTLNTTAAQEVVITRARTEANAVGAGYANNGAYLLAVLTAKMLDVWHDQKQADRGTYDSALAAATQVQKDQIAAILGLPAGTLALVKA
jgi:hypothetical protein